MADQADARRRCRAPLAAALSVAALCVVLVGIVSAPAWADGEPPGYTARLLALRTEGRASFEAGDYNAALAAANDILRIAPNDPAGLRLRDDACQALLRRPLAHARRERRQAARSSLLRDLEDELLVPKPGVVLRGEATRRIRPAPAAELEPWERELVEKLRETATVEFHETPIQEALAQIAALGDLQIVLDPAAAAKARPVTLGRTKMPLSALLRWVARFAGLEYGLRDGVVFLTTAEGLLDQPVRRSYSITGLLTPPVDAQARREPGPLEPGGKPEPPIAVSRDPDAIGKGWVDFLRTSVAPDTWAADAVKQQAPRYSIAYRSGRIVVVHTPEVHKQISRMLADFRRTLHLQVHINCRFLFIARAELEALNLQTTFDTLDEQPDRHWRILGSTTNNPERGELTRFPTFAQAGGGLSLIYSYLGDDQAGVFFDAVRKHQRATLLQSGRVTCFNTQRANFQSLLLINYVRRITTDEEPEVGNIPEGFILDVQPFVSADRRYITLTLQPQMRQLLSLTSFDFTSDPEEFVIGPDPEPVIRGRTIQIATTTLYSVATTVTIPNGGTLLVGGFSDVELRSAAAGIPLIEHIPLLGRTLRGTNRAEGRRTMFILVTAETVPDLFSGD